MWLLHTLTLRFIQIPADRTFLFGLDSRYKFRRQSHLDIFGRWGRGATRALGSPMVAGTGPYSSVVGDFNFGNVGACEVAVSDNPAHPVAEVYRAFKAMPYDAPSAAAVFYAVHSGEPYWKLLGTGNVRRLTLDSTQQDKDSQDLYRTCQCETNRENIPFSRRGRLEES